jgi:hypothetical protein
MIEADCAFPKDYQKDECVRAMAVSQPPFVERNGRSGNGWTLLQPADFPIYGTDPSCMNNAVGDKQKFRIDLIVFVTSKDFLFCVRLFCTVPSRTVPTMNAKRPPSFQFFFHFARLAFLNLISYTVREQSMHSFPQTQCWLVATHSPCIGRCKTYMCVVVHDWQSILGCT